MSEPFANSVTRLPEPVIVATVIALPALEEGIGFYISASDALHDLVHVKLPTLF